MRDLNTQKTLLSSNACYYFVPIQVESDAQLKYFSSFSCQADFFLQVIKSFAMHAPEGALLVFKEHPHGRGAGGYRAVVREIAKTYGVESRILYLVEGDTPILVANSVGVVTINSTVGIRALKTRVPLIALGEAIYKKHRLAFEGQLDDFWTKAYPATSEACANYLLHLKNLTQVPVCAYASSREAIDWS